MVVGRTIRISRSGVKAAGTSAVESALGDLATEAQCSAVGTDFAFLSSGGLRLGIEPPVPFLRRLYDAKPFGDRLAEMELEGARVYRLPEQQYTLQRNRTLQVSGLRYTYDPSLAIRGTCHQDYLLQRLAAGPRGYLYRRGKRLPGGGRW